MNALRRWLGQCFSREEKIPLATCVHYTGCRYGRGEVHPYESYALRFAQGAGDEARAGFIHFLQHYRPRHFGEALGLDLSRDYALWQFPWVADLPAPAWRDDSAACPDIVTHFSARGIPWSRIEEEFHWLERALATIREHGYTPRRFGAPITVRRLVSADGQVAHLVLDGNHRLSALAALGHREVVVRLAGRRDLHESEAGAWPQVRSGQFTLEDARAVLRAYRDGNFRTMTSAEPAPILRARP